MNDLISLLVSLYIQQNTWLMTRNEKSSQIHKSIKNVLMKQIRMLQQSSRSQFEL